MDPIEIMTNTYLESLDEEEPHDDQDDWDEDDPEVVERITKMNVGDQDDQSKTD